MAKFQTLPKTSNPFSSPDGRLDRAKVWNFALGIVLGIGVVVIGALVFPSASSDPARRARNTYQAGHLAETQQAKPGARTSVLDLNRGLLDEAYVAGCGVGAKGKAESRADFKCEYKTQYNKNGVGEAKWNAFYHLGELVRKATVLGKDSCAVHEPLYAQIYTDLAPWFKTGIRREDMDSCPKDNQLRAHLVTKNNTVYVVNGPFRMQPGQTLLMAEEIQRAADLVGEFWCS